MYKMSSDVFEYSDIIGFYNDRNEVAFCHSKQEKKLKLIHVAMSNYLSF